MDIRRNPEQQAGLAFTDQYSRLLAKRCNLPPLRDRFRVEVEPGTDAPESMSDRSRALAAWMLERWREDRKAESTDEGILQSHKHSIQTSRDELN